MKNKAQLIELERGQPLKQVLKECWEKHGSQKGIADELGVKQGTVSYWFLRYKLRVVSVLVDADEEKVS